MDILEMVREYRRKSWKCFTDGVCSIFGFGSVPSMADLEFGSPADDRRHMREDLANVRRDWEKIISPGTDAKGKERGQGEGKRNLVIVDTVHLFLRVHERSSYVVAPPDNYPAGSRVSVRLEHPDADQEKGVKLETRNEDHFDIVIWTDPDAILESTSFLRVGWYGYGKGFSESPLYLGFVVLPQASLRGHHNVILTFYADRYPGTVSNSPPPE